jgi:hypothetical protein
MFQVPERHIGTRAKTDRRVPARAGTETRVPERAKPTSSGWLLAVAGVLLLLLAVAQGYVSYRAQYEFVHRIKKDVTAAQLEALGLDAAAVIFALLGLALAAMGRPAFIERFLNVACVAGSLTMNAFSADMTSPKSIAAWTLPALLYAAASDRLIAVVRRQAMANIEGADDERSAYAAVAGTGMWALRLVLAPITTIKGFRLWVVETAPVAPGRRSVQSPTPKPAPVPAPVTAPTTPPARPDVPVKRPAPVTPRPVAAASTPSPATVSAKVPTEATSKAAPKPKSTGKDWTRHPRWNEAVELAKAERHTTRSLGEALGMANRLLPAAALRHVRGGTA